MCWAAKPPLPPPKDKRRNEEENNIDEPLIIKLNSVVIVKDLEKFKQYCEKQGIQNVVFIPECMDVVQSNSVGYRIFTKDSYKRHKLSNSDPLFIKGFIKGFDERWERMSKGHNFIIGVGKDELMFYSVEYFDKEILGGTSNEQIR